MNQTIEIALHYYLHKNLNKGWVKFLPVLRSRLNNAISASMGKAPNQIIFGFKTNDPLTLLRKSTGTEIKEEHTIARREAEDSISFANVYMKTNYDWGHLLIQFKLGDKVYLKLHKGYNIPGETRKLGQQRVRPLKVKARISTLAYRLEIPDSWKIHDVISIAHLEPGPKGEDEFSWPQPNQAPPVTNTDSDYLSYKIEKLVDQRVRRYSKGKPRIKYWVKWKGWGPEWSS